MSNTVIKIEHLSKMYQLGVINNGVLFRDIQSWWALKRGKEDPHSQIGEDKCLDSNTEFWALKDLTFDIKQGDRVGIIGKNGAGKSTLLKVLSRITTPTEGSVKIRGKISSLLEVGTGFHGELTGRENIYLNGAILGMKKREIDRKLDEIIDFSGIEKHIDTPVKRYSSGMYVRLAFAVAAHLDSDILIADEVLAVGDAEFQKKTIGKMSELSTGQGRTVLFVSHNMAAVKSLCNKGVILEKGRLKFTSDNIDEAIEKYNHIPTRFLYTDDSIVNRLPIQIIYVKLVEAYINNSSKYIFGNNLTLDIEVKCNETCDELFYYLAFVSCDTGTHTANSSYMQICSQTVQHKTMVKFSIKISKLTLPIGKYNLYLWVGEKKATKSSMFYHTHLENFISSVHIISATHDDNNYDGYYIATQNILEGIYDLS